MATAAPTRTDRRRERTRGALIAAARELFAARGASLPTIQEITDAADVAKGSFYNHFDSREALERAVAEAALEQMGAALDRDVAEREPDPARVVARSLHTTLRTCLDDPVLGAFVAGHPDVLALGPGVAERGRRDLERGIASGRFQIDDVETALTMLAGAGHAVLRARLRGALDEAAPARVIAAALRMLGLDGADATAIADDVVHTASGGSS